MGGRAEYISACAINSNNRAVQCWHGLKVVDRRVRLSWDGRNQNGRIAPEGNYRFRFQTYDPVGNRATTTGGHVFLSHKR